MTENSLLSDNQASLAQIIGAISFALDLTEGQPAGHSLRCTWIGMHIGKALQLDEQTLSELYYSIILKDSGCSSNAARLWELYGSDERLVKRDYKTVDSQNFLQLARFVFRHTGQQDDLLGKMKRILRLGQNGERLANELVQTRCERGANIARQLGFNDQVAAGIHCLDEHWNGKGRPEGLKGQAIPLFSRIALLSQVIDVFYHTGSRHHALTEVQGRQNTWFDPELVAVFKQLSEEDSFWDGLHPDGLEDRVSRLEPAPTQIHVDEDQLDHIAEVFASIVDIKSSYTHDHSRRVALYADRIAAELGLTSERRRWLRRGALLHDVGKLGVSNHILDKPGKLNDTEWEAVKRHASLTTQVLQRMHPFRDIADVAGAHHEKLDGGGYPLGLIDTEISLETRIITTADIFDALSAARPYRPAIPLDKTLEIMRCEVGTAIDARCMAALDGCCRDWDLGQSS